MLIKHNSEQQKVVQNNLGNSLRALGELTRCDATLKEAVEALTAALNLENRANHPLGWETAQNNLALAQRWRGEITAEASFFDAAREGYAACETVDLRTKASFQWARLHWNIADLAVARYTVDPDPAHLVEARHYLAQARAIFVEGSEYQTQRCDDLLAKIDAANALKY